jgi:hypothetical protein
LKVSERPNAIDRKCGNFADPIQWRGAPREQKQTDAGPTLSPMRAIRHM